MYDCKARKLTAILLLGCCLVKVTFGLISVSPKNQHVNVGNEVTLTCTGTKTTSWSFDGVGAATTTTITSTTNTDRVYIDNTGGKYNLVITNAAASDAGIYRCIDTDGNKGAYLAVWSPVPSNTAQVNSGQEYINGDTITTTCSAGFTANSEVTAHLDVSTGETTTSVSGTISRTGQSVTIQNNAVSSLVCSFYFSVTPASAELDGSNTATQDVSPTGLSVSFCAETPVITPNLAVYVPNEILKCTSAGHDPPTVTWVDGSGATLSTGSGQASIAVPDAVGSSFSYQCKAVNSLTRLTCSEVVTPLNFRVELTTTPPSESTWNDLYLIPIILIPTILFGLLLAHALFRRKLELIRLGKTRVVEVLDAREYEAYMNAGKPPKDDTVRYDWNKSVE